MEMHHNSINLTGQEPIVSETVTVGRTCMFCSETYFITLIEIDYQSWFDGEFVQNSFFYLNVDQREMIISGSHPKCYNEAYGAFDEEEETLQDIADEVNAEGTFFE